MKPSRTLLATALAAGALVVIPTETASACGFSSGFDDCPIGTREPRLFKTDTGNFGIRLEETREPIGATSPTVPNNTNCYINKCEVQPHQPACWFCQSSGGFENLQRKVNSTAADQQVQQVASDDSTHGGRTMPGVPCMICGD